VTDADASPQTRVPADLKPADNIGEFEACGGTDIGVVIKPQLSRGPSEPIDDDGTTIVK